VESAVAEITNIYPVSIPRQLSEELLRPERQHFFIGGKLSDGLDAVAVYDPVQFVGGLFASYPPPRPGLWTIWAPLSLREFHDKLECAGFTPVDPSGWPECWAERRRTWKE